MSSEPIDQPPPRRFRATVVMTLAFFLAVATVLSVINTTRGPRLKSDEFDVAASVSRSGERLLIVTDQILRPVARADVDVVPAADVEIAAEGATVTVVFSGLLRYATPYVVRIRVAGQATGAASTLDYTFTTPAGTLFALQRAGGGAPREAVDRVVRRSLSGGQEADDATVYQAKRIQQYAVADPMLAVVTSGTDGLGELTIARLDESTARRTLVGRQPIAQLKSSGPGGVFGYVITGSQDPAVPPNRLMLVDPASTAAPEPVVGLDGKPLIVNSWYFVPGTRSVVVQNADSSVYLVDPLGTGSITPLGSHSYLHGFVPGTASLLVDDLGRPSIVDLRTGKATAARGGSLDDSSQLYQLVPLTTRTQLRLIGLVVDGSTRFAVEATGQQTGVIYRPDDPTTRIESVCVSPNGQLVAIETAPEDAVADGYSGVTGFTPTTTVLLEPATRRVTATLPGLFLVDWCG